MYITNGNQKINLCACIGRNLFCKELPKDVAIHTNFVTVAIKTDTTVSGIWNARFTTNLVAANVFRTFDLPMSIMIL